jgi:hypothetical protein
MTYRHALRLIFAALVLVEVAGTVALALRGNPAAFATFASAIICVLVLDYLAPRVRYWTDHPEVWTVGEIQGRWEVVAVVARRGRWAVVCERNL